MTTNYVKVLFDKFVPNKIVDMLIMLRRNKLDVSLLEKLKTKLLKVQAILNYAEEKQIATNLNVDHMLRYAVNKVEHLLDEFNATSQVLNNHLPSPFKRFNLLTNYELRNLIEALEVMSSGEQVGKLVVSNSNSDWDETSIQLTSLSTSMKGLLDKIVSTEFVENLQITKLDVSLLKTLEATLVRVLGDRDADVEIALLVRHDAEEICGSSSLVTLRICGLNGSSIDGKWLQHLTSLQNLEIVNAPKLKSLPKKGLPSSLSVLSMTRCPLLDASLRRKRGKEWHKIAHIPSIIIDGELIT